MTVVSASTVVDGLALGTNAIVKPPLQAWTLQIIGVRPNRSTRGCAKHLYFNDPVAPGHRSEICIYQLDPLFRAEVGDILHLAGRSGPFGITYFSDNLHLEKVVTPAN